MFIKALSQQKIIEKPISIFVDKVNRREYLRFSKYELRYKIMKDGMYFLGSEGELKRTVKSTAEKRQILKDESLMYYEYDEQRITVENIAGTLLCDFLNTNFSDFADLKKFIDKYSLVILKEILKENGFDINLTMILTKTKYDNIIKEIATKYNDILESIKEAIIYDVDNCYNIYNDELKKDLTPYEIYVVEMFSNKYSRAITLYDPTKIYLECDNDMTVYHIGFGSVKEKHIIETLNIEKSLIVPSPYIISSLDLKQILFIEFKELLCIEKFPIKKCRNCEKYFVPDKRTDELYCNNLFEDTGKTCKEIGFFKYNQRKLKEDDVARLYRNTYQQKLLRVVRNPENVAYRLQLELFKEAYKEVKEKMANGKMTKEEFKEWLLKMKK